MTPSSPSENEVAASPDLSARSPRPASWTGAILLAVGFIAAVRRPDFIVHPQFWGEDSMILFRDTWGQGWHTLFKPYPAYFILAQRLVAYLAAKLPVVWEPTCYCYSAFGLMLLTAWYCLRARLDYLMDVRGRIALAFALPLVPQNGEIWLVLIGSQWTLEPILMLLILQDQTRRRSAAAVDFLGLLLAGMTGPFIVLFAPWFLLRFRRVTGGFSRYNIALVAAAWSVALIQILEMHHGPLPPNHFDSDPHEWRVSMGFWLPGGLFFGYAVTQYLGRLFWIISPALLAALAWALWRTERARFWPALALFGGGITIYLCGVSSMAPGISNTLIPFDSGGRYFYPLYLFSMWMGVIFYHDASRALRLAARMTLTMILLSSASFFTFPQQENLHWDEYARKVDAGQSQDNVPVLPNWRILIPAQR